MIFQFFQITYCCYMFYLQPDLHRGKGLKTTAPRSSQHVLDYMSIVDSAAECANTVNWQKETSHLFHTSFSFFPEREPGWSRESVGPEANGGPNTLSQFMCVEVQAVIGALHSHGPEL